MRTIAITFFCLAAITAACADPAANKPKAQTADATLQNSNSKPLSAPAARGESVALNPENSKVQFIGSKVTGQHEGGFKEFTGAIDLVDGKPEVSSVAVDINTKSVYTDTDALTTHLQSGDFFSSEQFPTASFVSTKITPESANSPGSFVVTGDLELRGVRKSVTFPATINVNADSVKVKAEFSINRKDFGIVYAGKADDLIRDDVVIKLDLDPSRKK